MLREFRLRVRLYSEWDRRLASRTRFYGAAALINTALADLCAHRAARLVLSRPTMEFLSRTGRDLESVNVALADRILWSEISGDDLDAFLVATEQTLVEHALQSVRAADAALFSIVVTQLNRVLQLTGHLFCASDSYLTALVSVSREQGRPVDFASRDDRIRIGRSLIAHLRY